MKLRITIDGKAYAVDVEILEDEEPGGESVNTPRPAGRITESYSQESWDSEGRICRSPVMGLVIKVNVSPGQEVSEGEQVVVLEAMKMETNITAPRAGVVKSVHVKAGYPVKLNQVLLELE